MGGAGGAGGAQPVELADFLVEFDGVVLLVEDRFIAFADGTIELDDGIVPTHVEFDRVR